VTHEEIRQGLHSNLEQAKRGALAFLRHFDPLPNAEELSQSTMAPAFFDFSEPQKLSHQSMEAVESLKAEMLNQLPAENISQFHLVWSEQGIDPLGVHKDYLDKFLHDFVSKIKGQIEQEWARKIHPRLLEEDPLVHEVNQHSSFCQALCDSFSGREEILQTIETHLESCLQNEGGRKTSQPSRSPLVIYGESGSGKTSLMAKASQLASYKYVKQGAYVLVRFIGTTGGSSSLPKLLSSLSEQISFLYGTASSPPPSQPQQLVHHFWSLLSLASPKHPLLIFLDSLDQLSSFHRAHRMGWVPKELPPNVSFVVSVISLEGSFLSNLRRHLPAQASFLELTGIPFRDAKEIFAKWLEEEGRRITGEQERHVEGLIEQCQLPLYYRLLFREVKGWASFQPHDESLPATIPLMIQRVFSKLEKQFGREFVSRSLGYITASPSGLSGAELEDLLSLDNQVLLEVYQFWLPPIRRIPPLLWSRLRSALGTFLAEREAEGSLVLAWYHRQFLAAARDRYLLQPEEGEGEGERKGRDHSFHPDGNDPRHLSELGRELHSNLADYFLGRWAQGEKKPFLFTDAQVRRFGLSSNEGAENRWVASQPHAFGIPPGREGIAALKRGAMFNYRKLSSLPFHLTCSGRMADLKAWCLASFDFILAKIHAFSISDLLADYDFALENHHDSELDLIRQTLRLAAPTLHSFPSLLSSELVGGLAEHGTGSGAPLYIQKLIEDARVHASLLHPIVPSFTCFTSPGGALQGSLEGHLDRVVDACISPNGRLLASCSWDRTVKVWNLENNTLAFSLPFRMDRALFTRDSAILLTWLEVNYSNEKITFAAWDAETGEKLLNLRSRELGKFPMLVSRDSSFVISGCSTEVKGQGPSDHRLLVWSLSSGSLVSTLREHSSQILDLSLSPAGSEIVSSSASGEVLLWDPSSWKVVSRFETGFPVSAVRVVGSASSPKIAVLSSKGTGPHLFQLPTGARISDPPLDCPWFDPNYFDCYQDPLTSEWSLALGSHNPSAQILQVWIFGEDGTFLRSAETSFQPARTGVNLFRHLGSFCFLSGQQAQPKIFSNVETRLVKELRGHSKPILCTSIGTLFSKPNQPPQPILCTSSVDSTIKIWNLSSIYLETGFFFLFSFFFFFFFSFFFFKYHLFKILISFKAEI